MGEAQKKNHYNGEPVKQLLAQQTSYFLLCYNDS